MTIWHRLRQIESHGGVRRSQRTAREQKKRKTFERRGRRDEEAEKEKEESEEKSRSEGRCARDNPFAPFVDQRDKAFYLYPRETCA